MEREFEPKIGEQGEREKETQEEMGENEDLVRAVLENPLVQKGLEVYKTFGEIYNGSEIENKEAVKQRADAIFSKDGIYQGILRDPNFLESEEYKKQIAEVLEEDFGKEEIERLKRAQKEGEKEFSETLKELIISRQIERSEKDPGREGGVFVEIGDMYVDIIDDECQLHLPRISENIWEVGEKIKKSMAQLADLLRTDSRFKVVKIITAMSWALGNEVMAKRFNRIVGSKPLTEERIKEILPEEIYQGMQKNGARLSARLLKDYLINGSWPKIGGSWITKEEFLFKHPEEE